MARYELLNNEVHKDLRVAVGYGPQFGDAVGAVPAFPTEFAELVRDYPILLKRNAEGSGWDAFALLGFDKDENLFLQDGRWDAGYLPGYVAKGPFLIGFQAQVDQGVETFEPVIHVDMDHPRVGAHDGVPVFLPQAVQGPYLEYVIGVLRGIHAGVQAARSMYAEFERLGLIQRVELDRQFTASTTGRLRGFHAIARERLAGLADADVVSLHRSGWLEGAYLMLASLYNVNRLVARKRARLAAQG